MNTIIKAMNINLNTISNAAFTKMYELDKQFVGTENYMGLAYYWNYEYRHYLRDAKPYIRMKVHNSFLIENLPIADATEKHFQIIKKHTKLN
jgi:hypothetical protein